MINNEQEIVNGTTEKDAPVKVVLPQTSASSKKYLVGIAVVVFFLVLVTVILIGAKERLKTKSDLDRIHKLSPIPTKSIPAKFSSIPTKIPPAVLKTSPITFGKYTINLPANYGWVEVKKDFFPDQDAFAIQKNPGFLVHIKDVDYNKGDNLDPEIIIADQYDNLIDNGIIITCPKEIRLGSPGFIADYETSWACVDNKIYPERK